MDIVPLIAMIILVVAALVLILYPLWQQTRPEAIFQVNRTGQTLEEYQARYQALLDSIKDLIFDHEMGKVASHDYEALLAKSKLEAARVRQEIDHLRQTAAPNALNPDLDSEIEALIIEARRSNGSGDSALLQEVEAEIELLKNMGLPHAAGPLACHNCGLALQPGDAFCSRCGQPVTSRPAANSCTQCGTTVQPDDAFCANCGAALTKETATPTLEDAKI